MQEGFMLSKKSHILISDILANSIMAYSQIKKLGLRETQNYIAVKCWSQTINLNIQSVDHDMTKYIDIPCYLVMPPEKIRELNPSYTLHRRANKHFRTPH